MNVDDEQKLQQWRNGEVISETWLTPEKKAEIIREQTNAAHFLLSSLGYGVGHVSTLPNALMTSALSSYCKTSDAFNESCPDISTIDLRIDDLLAALQSSLVQKQSKTKIPITAPSNQ